jgi:phospholipid-binding lipoprotein MlaA
VGNGPYLVLPIFGPSNLRDGVGIVADSGINYFTDPINVATDHQYTPIYNGTKAIDTRAHTAFRYYATGSPFEYDLVRLFYTKYREVEIMR